MREDKCKCAIPKLRQESDYWGAGNCRTSSGLRLCLGTVLVKMTPQEYVVLTAWARLGGSVETYYCLWQAVGNDLMFEVEVINPKDNQGDVAKEDWDVKAKVLNDGGRQENSLRTVRSILQVLYTNTGWSVRTCLGQVQIQVIGERLYCTSRSCDLFVDLLIRWSFPRSSTCRSTD